MQQHRQLNRVPRRYRGIPAALLCVAVAACSPTLENHGHLPDKEIVQSVRIGQSNRDQVREMLGTPSTVSTFDKEAWYYIGARTSRYAFLDPEVLERKVLVIRFDKDGVVQQVEHLEKEDGRPVQLVDRKTPTRGKELSLLEQLVGNVGRFGGGSTDNFPGGSGGP